MSAGRVSFLALLVLTACAWTSARAVGQVFVPSGTYKVKVLNGAPLPANVDIEFKVEVKSVFHAEITPRVNFHHGTGWFVSAGQIARLTFLTGRWETVSGSVGVCRYDAATGGYQFETTQGTNPGRIVEATPQEGK